MVQNKRLQDITDRDIIALVAAGAEESQELEFIRQYDGKPGDIVNELVAMSNASRGMLILGIEENAGKASGIRNVDDAQTVCDSVMQAFGDTVEPKLPRPEYRVIGVEQGSEASDVLVFTITAPAEAVRFISVSSDRYKCPIRVGTTRRRMSYSEIRSSFTEDLLQRRLDFIDSMLRTLTRQAAEEDEDGDSASLGR